MTATRSSTARRVLGDRRALEKLLARRVEGVLAHDRPASANRLWLCESIRGWAPLEVVFPGGSQAGTPGVSGELPRHYALLVERAFGHVLAATRNLNAACDLLRADAQLLELQIAVSGALLAAFPAEEARANWPDELCAMSLAMAEFLHRHAIGLSPVLSDTEAMDFTARISRLRRGLESACRGLRIADAARMEARQTA